MSEAMTIEELATKIRNDAMYWAPESRVSKLVAYLQVHGVELERALLAQGEDACGVCGLTTFRKNVRNLLTRMVETGEAPPRNKMHGKPKDEVRVFARPGLYRMLAEDVLIPVKADKLALDFVLKSQRLDSCVLAVGTLDEIIAEVERLAERYEMGSFHGRAAKPDEVSDLWES